jgi:hypothetical protein
MKTFCAVAIACVCVLPAFGQAPKGRGAMKAEMAEISDTIQKLEHEWTDAEKSGDVEKLSQIVAADWKGLQPDGTTITRKELLSEVKSGAEKIESAEFGPMDVKVMGRVAVVQGSDTEKSSLKGKDTSGKWIWMDVFVNRNGNWVAVRSQGAMAK